MAISTLPACRESLPPRLSAFLNWVFVHEVMPPRRRRPLVLSSRSDEGCAGAYWKTGHPGHRRKMPRLSFPVTAALQWLMQLVEGVCVRGGGGELQMTPFGLCISDVALALSGVMFIKLTL